MIYHGDLFDVLPTLAEASVDACVCDPPYGLEFMGKEWDKLDGSAWRAGDTRQPGDANYTEGPGPYGRAKVRYGVGASYGTTDRLTGYFAGEDNFKGLNLPRQRYQNIRCPECGKLAYDHQPCACGGIGRQRSHRMQEWHTQWASAVYRVLKPGAHLVAFGGTRTFHRLTCALEDVGFEIRDCLMWLYGTGFPKSLNVGAGRGTALKPGWEPIILARKPLAGTVATNVQTHGTGALNIDACRVGFTDADDKASAKPQGRATTKAHGAAAATPDAGREVPRIDFPIKQSELGRWPANVLLDEDAARQLDAQSGELSSGGGEVSGESAFGQGAGWNAHQNRVTPIDRITDIGGASRFFYVAKPDRTERELGCETLPPQPQDESRKDGNPGGDNPRNRGVHRRGNSHPTVKPIEVMRWLVRLVTPLNGTVLDPFMGSGTTGMACRAEQRAFIGIEREATYVAIAERRLAAIAPLFHDNPVAVTVSSPPTAQPDLFEDEA